MYYEPSLGFVWTSERRAQFIVDAQTVTSIPGETVDTRQVDWCDQKHTVEGQTDTDRPSCVSRTVKSRARPKGVNLKR